MKEYYQKATPTDHEIIDIIKDRWSPRTFADDPIEVKNLKRLFEAARWAPSSNNWQPWVFIYGAKGDGVYDRIMNCLVEFNQGWAKQAPLLMLTGYKKDRPDGKENFHALHDLGLSVGNMQNQATAMGIMMHQMAGVKFDEAKKEFKLPENYHIATAIALGYPGGEVGELPDDLQKEERKNRSRKSQSEFVFNGDFSES